MWTNFSSGRPTPSAFAHGSDTTDEEIATDNSAYLEGTGVKALVSGELMAKKGNSVKWRMWNVGDMSEMWRRKQKAKWQRFSYISKTLRSTPNIVHKLSFVVTTSTIARKRNAGRGRRHSSHSSLLPPHLPSRESAMQVVVGVILSFFSITTWHLAKARWRLWGCFQVAYSSWREFLSFRVILMH